MLTFECIRGGKATEKCPVQPALADLVLIHKYVLQAIAKPANELNDDFDFWAFLSNTAKCSKRDFARFSMIIVSKPIQKTLPRQ